MDKIAALPAILLFCSVWLGASFVKERSKLLKEVDKNLRSASLDQLDQYRKKLLMFRKSLLVVIIEIARRKRSETGHTDVENMLGRVELEIEDRMYEQQRRAERLEVLRNRQADDLESEEEYDDIRQ